MGDPNVPKIGPSVGVLGSDIGFSGGFRALVFRVFRRWGFRVLGCK